MTGVIFPFEEPFYKQNHVEAEFVGHPLAELPPPTITREHSAANRTTSIQPLRTWHRPAPRRNPRPIRRKCSRPPEKLQLAAPAPEALEFLVLLVPTLNTTQRARVLQMTRDHGPCLMIRLVDDARAALFHARASVCSQRKRHR